MRAVELLHDSLLFLTGQDEHSDTTGKGCCDLASTPASSASCRLAPPSLPLASVLVVPIFCLLMSGVAKEPWVAS